jgi:DNA-binding Lrp family transcriptional regulator
MQIIKSLSDYSGFKYYSNKNLYNKTKVINGVTYQRVRDIDYNKIKPERAGVIVYFKYRNMLYFCLGMDSNTHEFTDFGGSVKYKIENCIKGALREFREESLVFRKLSINEIDHFYSIYDDKNIVIFVGYELDPKDVNKKFIEKFYKIEKPEVCSLVWMRAEVLQKHIKNGDQIFYRLRDFLLKAEFDKDCNINFVI